MEQDKKDIGRAILEIFGRESVAYIIAQLKTLDKVASGELLDSIDYKLKNFISSLELDFEGAKQAVFVLQGRKIGSYVPLKPLQAWMRIRNIPLKYTFLINRKIFRFGIRPVNFISDITSNSTIDKLVNKLEDNYAKEIENQLVKYFYEKT